MHEKMFDPQLRRMRELIVGSNHIKPREIMRTVFRLDDKSLTARIFYLVGLDPDTRCEVLCGRFVAIPTTKDGSNYRVLFECMLKKDGVFYTGYVHKDDFTSIPFTIHSFLKKEHRITIAQSTTVTDDPATIYIHSKKEDDRTLVISAGHWHILHCHLCAIAGEKRITINHR